MKLVTLILSLFLTSCITNTSSRNCVQKKSKISNSEIEVDVLEHGDRTAPKTLIILPPTGRTNYIDKKYAEQFCQAGYDVYITDKWSNDTETVIDLEIHEHFYGQAQKAVSAVIENIKSPFIGILGTSVGGLHASVSASVQDKVNAVFVITAGISIAEVIVTSDQEAMVGLKRDRKSRYGFKDEKENIDAIQKVFTLEPEKLPKKFESKDLGIAVAMQDNTVPTATQLKLKEFWKPKKILAYSSNHFWGIVKTWLLDSDQVLEFFEDSSRKVVK